MTALSIGALILVVFAVLLGLGLVAGVLWVGWKVLRGVFWLLGRVLGFVRREVVDALHAAGAAVTAGATVPLALGNLAILRLGAARHYARSFVDELKGVGVGLWRVGFGNPLRFVGLGALVEGVEGRLPETIERAPRTRRARRATFEGYDVIGTLPSGGSGAQLFVARPRSATHKRFLAAGRGLPGEVVIKSFALETGSTLPQIVRESRALEAASKLGLVCEHQLTNDHFYYVMPYVKGEDLERVTRALHARGTSEGLADPELALVLGYAIDLLDSLQRFHSGGLWHKDVKPSNVIVAKGRAHLVDFGLVTPLASALTLTTHGTEYYRDPEMVRLAMQGVKVHEVDGVRFDVYSAGAVLYTMLENSFPAHGSLSRLSRRAPEALRWIVQRAMAEMGSRYASAAEMRADLAALASSARPFELRPADLPSFQPNRGERAPLSSPAPVAASWGVPPPVEPIRARVVGQDEREADFRPEPLPLESVRSVPRRRRRVVPALALTGAGFVGLFALASAARLVAVAHEPDRGERSAFVRRVTHTPVATRDVRARRPLASLSEQERKLVGLAEGVVEDLGTPSAAVPSPVGAVAGPGDAALDVTAEARTEPMAAPGSVALPARGRVLVIDDLTTGVDARVLARLRARLVERGFSVAGVEAGPEDGDAAAAVDAVELLAGARHALGLGRADEPATQASLQRFLDRATDLDALILVSRPEEDNAEEHEHLYRVFVRVPELAGTAGDLSAAAERR